MAVLFLKKIMVVVGEFYRVFMVVYSLLLMKCNQLGSCDRRELPIRQEVFNY